MSYTIYDTPAIVADSWPYKDASRRLLVYSKDIGRILVQAQGVRKLESKLGPAVQLYSESQLELVYGKAGWRLVGAQPKQNFFFSPQTDESPVVRVTNLLTHLVPEQQADAYLYRLITEGFAALESAKSEHIQSIETLLVFRLVAHLGYAPDSSASNLYTFTNTVTYSESELREFREVQDQAVQQINQALRNTQL